MAEQLACVFSTIRQTGSGFEPHFSQNMQAGERFSGSIEFLPDNTSISIAKDFVPSGDNLTTAAGITLCYVWADELRITAADGNSNYLVIWKMYTDNLLNPTSTMPGDNMASAELQAIQDYLVLNTGYLAGQISSWIISKFNVSTQQEAVTWSTTRPRTATVNKLIIAMRLWSQAKQELDNL